MYIKGIDKRIFKDVKETYLAELYKIYKGKDLANKINNDINQIKLELNIQLLSNLNINYWLVRGWNFQEAKEKIINLKQKRKKPKTCLQKVFWINKGLSENDAIKKISEIQRKNNQKFNKKRKDNPENYKTSSPMTIEFWTNKGLTKENAKEKIKSQRKLNKEYWIARGYTESDAIKNVSEFQLENNKKFKKNKEKNPEKYIGTLPIQLEYYLKRGYSIEEAKFLLKDRQTTFSLEKCIKRYGEENGLERWKARQEKWKAKVFNKDTYIGRGESILSNNIINEIIKYEKAVLLYGKDEKFIYDKNNHRAYKYDLTKPSNKKIIEINGIFWHCKPDLYTSDHIHKITKHTAKEIWEYDKIKINLAEKYGYEVLVIWEDDFYENPQMIINKCVKFLKDERN